MHILVVNTLPIPSGEASVNRLMSYSRGLVEREHKVTILSSAFSEEDNLFHSINGIEYRNCSSKKSILALFKSLCIICSYIWTHRKELNAVIIVSNSALILYPVWLSSKLSAVPYLMEKSEFPMCLIHKKNNILHHIYSWLLVNCRYRICDGMVVMTNPLKEYYKTKVKSSCKMHLMPMSVDASRFQSISEEPPIIGDYIAYCGNMAGNKDGVYNLINAFIKIESKYPSLKLVLIGGSTDSADFENLKQLARPHKQIQFVGKVSREEMPVLLSGAKLLALARPSSIQASGGFPTKLGEYLSTGNPVVITAAGEIPYYLNENNSFIVEPDNNDLFAEALDQALSDYENAKARGREGQNLAMSTFDYTAQSADFEKFLLSF